MGSLAISLFGAMRVELNNVLVEDFESDKVRALLAYLAVEHAGAHRREQLAALLWPDYPEERARRNLNQVLYSLRNLLGERNSHDLRFFTSDSEIIQLNPKSEIWVDLLEFTCLIEASDRHAHHLLETCQACQDQLQRAILLYKGDFLERFSLRNCPAFDEWTLVTREHCRQLARHAFSSVATSYTRKDRLLEALQAAQCLFKLDPYDETACRQLMRLYTATGQRGEALVVYRSLRTSLRNELDVTPQDETTTLYERIRQLPDGSLLQPNPHHNLPASLSPMIGRETELAELQQRLLAPDGRLLTILGPGGIGKSRLALEIARGLIDRFSDGVFMVQLTPLDAPAAILPSIAEAIGLRFADKRSHLAQLKDYLGHKELLLVMDGCESLLVGFPSLLEILSAAPEVKILATSRTRLNVEEEQVYVLSGLEFPALTDQGAAENCAAVRLFTSGARRVQPNFQLDVHTLPAVVEICAEVEGMPLAILLAAAWSEVFSPLQILTEMRSNLDFLQAEWMDIPPRQRSIRATFDYSWKLLEANEQSALQALCIFRGKFTRQAVEQVGKVTSRTLRYLVSKSLLMLQPDDQYSIHTLLRQYGLEKLNAQPVASQEVRQRYGNFYLDQSSTWKSGLKGSGQIETLALVDANLNDLRQAWDWACQQAEIERLHQTLETLCLYYELRARFMEGQRLCQESALNLGQDPSPNFHIFLAHLAAWEARFCRLQGELGLARQLLTRSQVLVDQGAGSSLDIRPVLGLINLEEAEMIFTADLAVAQKFLLRSLELYRQIGDHWRTANILHRLGVNRGHACDYDSSKSYLSEATRLYQMLAAPAAIASVERIIAQNLVRQGKTEDALELMRRVIVLSQASGDPAQTMLDIRTLGLLLLWNGLFSEVFELFEQAFSLAQALGNRYEITFIHGLIGAYAHMTAQYPLAHQHLELVLEFGRKDGFQREVAFALWALGCITLVEKSAQEARRYFDESINLYRLVGHQDELGAALAMDSFCLTILGETNQARKQLEESLAISDAIHGYLSALFSIFSGAYWLYKLGVVEKSHEFYTLVAQEPVFFNSPWFKQLTYASIPIDTNVQVRKYTTKLESSDRQPIWNGVKELLEIITTNMQQ